MPNSTRSKKKSRSPIDIFYEARKLSKRTKLNRRAKSYSKKESFADRYILRGAQAEQANKNEPPRQVLW